MAPHDQGTKHMNNGENKKRKRILTLSQKEIQRSPLKKGKSPRKNVEFKSAHALVKQFQIKREIVLASCEKDTDHEVGRQSTMPIKKRTNEAERQSKMMMKKMTNEEEGQGKMSMKKMTNEAEGQSKMSMKMTNESEGQSKMPMKKMTNEPEEQSKMLSLKKKMNTNEVEVQSKTIKKKNMTTNEVGGDNEVEEQSYDDMSNDKDKTLIPALSLDDFFTQYGIQVDEDDAEFEYDYDGDNINDDNSTTKKKTRGPTQLKDIHAMEGQIQILWDNGKPIGPTKAKVLKFSRFLGTLARNTSLVTLLYTSWQAVSETSRTALLTYAKSKYTIPNNGEPWVFATIAEAWKQFKKRIKQQHFKPYNSFREMLKNRPLSIPEVHFRKLIRYWNLDVNKVISSKNAGNRSKQKWNHRMGPVSFELVRMELRANNENNEDPSQCEMFIATRRDKKGETNDSQTQEMIDHLQNLKDAGHSDDEAFQSLFGKERPGRVRCYGRTVTKTSLKKEKEINQIKQEHKQEVAHLQDEVHHVDNKMDDLTNLVKVLLQQVNPDLSADQVQVMIEAAQQSPPDASSAPNEAR